MAYPLFSIRRERKWQEVDFIELGHPGVLGVVWHVQGRFALIPGRLGQLEGVG